MTTINDIRDLVRIVEEHPEWRSELQRLLLTKELLETPDKLTELTAVTENLANTARSLLELAEDTNRRLDRIADRFETIEGDVKTLKDDVGTLKGDMSTLKDDMGTLKGDVSTVKDDTGTLQGYNLERKMHSRLRQRISRTLRLRKARAIWTAHVDAQATGRAERFENLTDSATDDGLITDDEAGRLLDTDMVMTGIRISDGELVHIAVEASSGIRTIDIDRARESASILHRLYGTEAIPVVYGYNIAHQQVNEAQPDPANSLLEVHIIMETDRS